MTGSSLLVVNGGPGLSHGYLRDALLPLEPGFSLHFYDQLGCGSEGTRANEVTADKTIRQLADIVDSRKNEKLSIFAHSWGSLLVIACHAKHGVLKNIKNLILCNPAPLNRADNEAAGAALLSRFSEQSKSKLSELLRAQPTSANGAEIMQLALEAYCSPNTSLPVVAFEYSREVYHSVDATLGEHFFDNVPIPSSVDLTLIYGEDDYISRDFTKNLLQFASQAHVLPRTGHFAPLESPEAVQTILRGLAKADDAQLAECRTESTIERSKGQR